MTDRFPTPEGNGRDSPPQTFFAEIGTRFVVERELGRGGMASVWLVRRRDDGRRYALKVLRPSLADTVPGQRFLREIRIAAEVRSPALVPLEEAGEAGGLPYYLMPHLDGGTLRDVLRRETQLRLTDALRITRRLATALEALHARGFVHRDIKPENILHDADGEAVLADFGIAHALATTATEEFTSTGVVIGTPQYMSPEQAGGLTVDARSDIYSLGCVLYEMLTGDVPFHGATPQALLARHMNESPPSLRVVRAAVPEVLEAVVFRMLAKVPADRFGSATELIAALDALGDLSRATEAWRAQRWRRTARRVSRALFPVAAVGVSIAAWREISRPPLDADRVIVFPFAAVGGEGAPDWSQLPMLVGSALDRTASTDWLDGYALLSEEERASGGALPGRRARALARRERARYYLDGTVTRTAGALAVQVRLHDAERGLLLDSKNESEAGRSAGELALRAVTRILPTLTGLDEVVDVSDLVGHDPAAIDNWLRGEREYRQSRMAPALRYFERALAVDSLLIPAAFRAAVAASWISRPESANGYVRLALRHDSSLAPRQRQLASALERFLAGRADESLERLWPQLGAEVTSADAWMLAGEVMLHLLPTLGLDATARTSVPTPTRWPTERFAQQAFERARVLDPAFSPPLAHLAEIAARRGDVAALERNVRALGLTDADSVLAIRTNLMQRCLRRGPTSLARQDPVRPVSMYHVGFALWGGSVREARDCGRAAFRAALDADVRVGAEDWGSLVGLHGLLASAGRDAEAMHLVDSAITAGLGQAVGLHVVGAAAGMDIGARADAFIAQLWQGIETRAAPSLWLLTLWSMRSGDVAGIERAVSRLDARRRSPGLRVDSLLAAVGEAYLLLARGDSAAALSAFDALRPTAELHQLENSLWEPLAPERLTHARLLLARGKAIDAHRVASTFDHPGILVHALFQRPSLEVRLAAARALGDAGLEREARQRLDELAKMP